MFIDKIPVRYRLSLVHALWMGLLFSAIGFGIFRLVQRHLHQSVEATLMGTAQAIRDARLTSGFDTPLIESVLERILGDRFLRPYAQLVDLSGKVRSTSRNVFVQLPVTPNAAIRAEKGLHTFEIFRRPGLAPLKQLTLPVVRGGRFTGELIQVGAPLDAIQDTLRGVAVILLVSLPTALVLAIIIGYVLTARVFKPVVQMQRSAAKITIEDLDQRLELPRARDELHDLARTYNEMLSRIHDAVGRLRRFTGDVSHELRTPIAVIRAEADLAMRRPREAAEYNAALQRIKKEANGMTSIVEDLLLLARAEGKSAKMTWSVVKLSKFIEDLQQSVALEFQNRKVKLNIDVDGDVSFEASSTYLSLALKNILINAAKHSPSEGNVHLRGRVTESLLTLSIKDEGEGISPQDLPHVFDTFYRADTARNRAAGGVGIGLSLAKALVKLHKGTITATSEVGSGSTFTVAIPLKRAVDGESSRAPLPNQGPARLSEIAPA